MIPRILAKKLTELSQQFPVVTILGPRQSGKTTLVKHAFEDLPYVSMEDLDTREYVIEDPREFLERYEQGAIFDEIQRVPDLLSYLQTLVDGQKNKNPFILTGSQNFLLSEKISQTLAGRTAILNLLPLSFAELRNTSHGDKTLEDFLFTGFYPRIYDQEIAPYDWYSAYVQTYLEKDVRLIKNISDLSIFQKFIRMCANRTGQLLNLSSLGNDCGITYNTAKSWLSVLETSFIIFLLRPHYENFNKRLVKMPKLYFYDTGLLSFLLNLESPDQLSMHYLKGGIFESFIISEIIKNRVNQGLQSNCYFWRDSKGFEVDCLIETGGKRIPIEIKSGKTISKDYFRNLAYYNELAKIKSENSFLVYGGEDSQKRSYGKVIGWNQLENILG